ncbi:SDR family NAD(P)-dependent oxidoreductase [Actinocrispum wychmicini]|uniref:Short-subunit dehydrogenase n=1 Tax=Actinocrispum wychmicini TaxID=1213861 RepID=A0A4R2JGA7_9PSEU|nr:SDR family NAD(P)-dependent oxidoreductase [Actinocrispum wychmicini]TCO55908.1 short-subunit dehydrogenase [Actinocrispum wychmicini]
MTALSGARILLTGGSSGIGRALALKLADRGARLAVAARREPQLTELAAEIAGNRHPAPYVLPVDLSVRGAAADLADKATRVLGGVDILINNAGVGLVDSQARLGDSAAARASFETNFWSPLALTTALLPGMRAAGTGTIVNVTSTIQAVPLPFLGYYAAAKIALAQATRSLRNELRHTPIRVLEVVPGATDTGLRDINKLPWHGGRPPRTLPPVPPEAVAAATVRALERDHDRVIHPAYATLPIELPIVGRLVAAVGARRVDTTYHPAEEIAQ